MDSLIWLSGVIFWELTIILTKFQLQKKNMNENITTVTSPHVIIVILKKDYL